MRERHRRARDRLGDALTGAHWIDGDVRPGETDGPDDEGESGGRTDAALVVSDPSTGDRLCDVAGGSADTVDAAVTAAAGAADEWAARGASERAALIGEWTAELAAHRDQLAETLTLEMGRPVSFAAGEVDSAVEFLEYYAAVERAQSGTHLQRGREDHTYVRQEPYGVVGIILPWNYPLELFAWKAGAALATGNAVVVKPSEEAPLALTRAVQLSAGALPDGVLNVVNGTGADVGEPMTAHDGIRKLSFTGSVPVGQTVMRRAADTVTPVSLELGGKNPFLVFPDADVEAAAETAASGIFFNTGQSCGAPSRAIVHESLHEEFVDAVVAAAEDAWVPGDPLDPETTLGPLAFEGQYEAIHEYVSVGAEAGAELVCGGDNPAGEAFADGYFFSPTVFDGVDPDSRIAQEELFGPVLSVMSFSEYDEAIEMANGVDYGLAAGLATSDMTTAHSAAADLEAGSVWVNDWHALGPGTPFGGFKQSGIGRECAAETLEAYRQSKTVSISLDGDPGQF